ncbi:MAG: aminotransferase class III-fold pyridoxal phosphate-dependent enzyme [Pseudomonadales bacterium]|nr:aminotransferase class III-fold pyridoxal phosphate-dependent enzyme [Pseudomonadales bacterium]
MDNKTLLAKRNQRLGVGAALFYNDPIQIVKGRGVELEDQDGNTYIDMYNNVPCVGHAHPHVVEAMHKQASTLNVHSRYLHEGIVGLADRLTGLHNDAIESVVFACSGTEANDVAMTMARVATGGTGFICTNAAYHGNSQQVSQLTHVPVDQSRSPNIRSFPFPEKFRPIANGDDETIGAAYLQTVDAAIADFEQAGVKIAGLLLCSIFANEGLPNIPKSFMAKAADRVRRAGGLVISDEVQAGYCRTGSWWGYQISGFTPDIVVTGKPMGNGLPLSACAASHDLVNEYRAKSRYFNTFASSPLQAAAGNAVLDVIENEDLAANAKNVGAYLRSELEGLVGKNQHFAEVRGHGLFLGLEWVKDKDSQEPDREGAVQMVNALKGKGFLTSNAGAFNNIVKIRPPLVFARHHADQFLEAFADCL